ncbi:MAG: hypothetical protein NZ703_06195, partial [Gemmataceae bacterium]|nr:hypothetical protein [Gemmataceae bacterium]
MSLAYRITLEESATRVLRAEDEVTAALDVLEVLPAEQMAELLRQACRQRGFSEQPDGTYRRQQGECTVVVHPQQGTVSVVIERERTVQQSATRVVSGFDDIGARPQQLRAEGQKLLKQEIEKKFEQAQQQLQRETADQLERTLLELQPEIDAMVNEVLREAIKIKARQMGQIREIHEDATT